MKNLFSEISNTSSKKTAVLTIAQTLFEAEAQTHIIHLQAKKKSYAEHIALDEFYKAIPDLVDELVEKTQGKYGPITGYKAMSISDNTEAIPYLESGLKKIEVAREQLNEGYLEQLTDNIIEQYSQTLYKLKNLH